MRIDAHHHFWKYDPTHYGWIDDTKQILKQDFLPPELKAQCVANQIDGVISVQARQTIAETTALLDFADANDWILAVVGWVPLREANVANVLDQFASRPKLRSVRHVVQDEPDDNFMLGDDFVRGIALLQSYNLVYDLLVYPHQLPAAIHLADHFPEQTFVLDHIAKPTITRGAVDERWRSAFVELAKRENVSCKFSGLITEVREPQWNVDLVRPYWDVALRAFGARRLMFGTDWPVCLLRGSYSQWATAVAALASELTGDEQQQFWSGSAMRAYSLAGK